MHKLKNVCRYACECAFVCLCVCLSCATKWALKLRATDYPCISQKYSTTWKCYKTLFNIVFYKIAGKSATTMLHKPIDRRRTLFLRFPKIESPPNKKYNVFETNVKKHTPKQKQTNRKSIYMQKKINHTMIMICSASECWYNNFGGATFCFRLVKIIFTFTESECIYEWTWYI